MPCINKGLDWEIQFRKQVRRIRRGLTASKNGRGTIKSTQLVYKNPDKPLIRDLIIEGLSLARTQKEEFASILNTNNGYTIFKKNNKKIKSVQNKLIDFDGRLQHTGTSCTDAPYRMVINFVYK